MKINQYFKNMFYLVAFIFFSTGYGNAQDYIIVNKKNVMHKFVPFDQPTDHFVRNVFANWENETFDVFDRVKDSQGIAIDLGAWIGTTAIWLSKNFYHVIAIDADKVSLRCLENNLKASECTNVSICDRPIAKTSQKVVFGPRGDALNASISYIKNHNSLDYAVQAMTFKQLLHDYVFKNENIKSHKISFIKCDIEGGEEGILEDVLYFAYHNKTKVYLSFHVSWWKSKKITDFEYLFKFFKIHCPSSNVAEYIIQNPFVSLLFEPLEDAGTLIKKNIPVVIIGYNQYSYIKNMVEQLEKYTSDIIVIDNNSDYQPLLNYYKNDFKYTLLKQKTNFGHDVYSYDFVQNLIGDIYILTDPDLQFNSKLPKDFIKTFLDISFYFNARKVGFALSIDSNDIRTDISYGGKTIKELESAYWKIKLSYPNNSSLKLFDAPIDTTFCLINKRSENLSHIRVAGDYTCLHLPWYRNFLDKLQEGEYEAYMQNNISSCWFKKSNVSITN